MLAEGNGGGLFRQASCSRTEGNGGSRNRALQQVKSVHTLTHILCVHSSTAALIHLLCACSCTATEKFLAVV